MTLNKAERWTGLSIQIFHENGAWFAHGWLDPTIPPHAIGRSSSSEAESLQHLVNDNLRVNGNMVRKQQKWRCAIPSCGKIRPLQIHHVKLRQSGGGQRDDRIENLRGVCFTCHASEHGQKVIDA